jgi:hypothetical protein
MVYSYSSAPRRRTPCRVLRGWNASSTNRANWSVSPGPGRRSASGNRRKSRATMGSARRNLQYAAQQEVEVVYPPMLPPRQQAGKADAGTFPIGRARSDRALSAGPGPRHQQLRCREVTGRVRGVYLWRVSPPTGVLRGTGEPPGGTLSGHAGPCQAADPTRAGSNGSLPRAFSMASRQRRPDRVVPTSGGDGTIASAWSKKRCVRPLASRREGGTFMVERRLGPPGKAGPWISSG